MTPHQQLARVVDGAIRDTFNCHPDYLTKKGKVSARRSLNKRITGTVLGFAVQAAKGGVQPASTPQAQFPSEAREGVGAPSQPFRVRIGRIRVKRIASSRQMLPFNETTAMLIRARAAEGSNG